MPKRVAYSKTTSAELLGIRKKLQLTQVQIAKLLGMSLRMYRYYEVDKKPISVFLEKAVGTLLSEESQGTLTSYDFDRISRLRQEIDKTLSVGSVDVSHIEKILKQSSKELQNVLSKA